MGESYDLHLIAGGMQDKLDGEEFDGRCVGLDSAGGLGLLREDARHVGHF